MCTQRELNLMLDKLIKAYKSVYGEKIVKIILYGSYARGDYDEQSDVDVVALVQGDRELLQKQLRKVWDISCDLELEYGVIISASVIPYDEYKQYIHDLPYYRNIAEEGVEIVA